MTDIKEYCEKINHIKDELLKLNVITTNVINANQILREINDEIKKLTNNIERNKREVNDYEKQIDDIKKYITTKAHLYIPETDSNVVKILNKANAIKKTIFNVEISSDNENNYTANGMPCEIEKKILYTDSRDNDVFTLTLTENALSKGKFSNQDILKDDYVPVVVDQMMKLNKPIEVFFSTDPYGTYSGYDMSLEFKKKHEFKVISINKKTFILEINIYYYDACENDPIKYIEFNKYYSLKNNILQQENKIKRIQDDKPKIIDLINEYANIEKQVTSLGHQMYELFPGIMNLLKKDSFFGVKNDYIKPIEHLLIKKRYSITHTSWENNGRNDHWECLSENPSLYRIQNLNRYLYNSTENSIRDYFNKNTIELYTNGYGYFYLNKEMQELLDIDIGKTINGEACITLYINVYYVKSKMSTRPPTLDEYMTDMIRSM